MGAGNFAAAFIPLFKAHPGVEQVALAEVFPERLREQAERFGITECYSSLEEMLAGDVDAVAIFSQRWTHGPMAVKALNAGKHVYSAVPAAITIEEVGDLVDAVKRTGLIYMMGETSYYYPATIYCRDRYVKGDMGDFVYGEGEYLHDMTHGFYAAYQHSGGDDWKKHAGFPPMLYPTHSVSMIVSVTGQYMTHVSCLGYKDRVDDGVFLKDVSLWGNEFSNETALFRTSGGAMARVNEFRRIGYSGGNCVRCSIYGTLGSYEEQAESLLWVARDSRPEHLDSLLRTNSDIAPYLHDEFLQHNPDRQSDFKQGFSPVHPRERLPKEFAGLGNWHSGSHHFLTDDFVTAVVTGKRPPVDVWAAARYTLPGIVAHESAIKDGESLAIPDFGEGPAR